MVLTGWTRDILGRQPGPIIAALFQRIVARGLAADLAEAERMLAMAEDRDITQVPTSERAELRRLRELLRVRVAGLQSLMGHDDG